MCTAFFGSIAEDFGNRGESTKTKLPTRNKQWQTHHRKDQTTANRMTVFFFTLGRNWGMATGTLPREFAAYHTEYYIARNVVIYCSLLKANNAFFSCQRLFLICGRFERSGQASCRAPNSTYQTRWLSRICSGAGGVISSRWRRVSVVTQHKMWIPLSKTSSKISFLNQARWSRCP